MIYVTDPFANLVYWINTTRYLTNPEKLVSAFQKLPPGITLNELSSFGIDTGPPIHVGKYPTGISVDNTNRWVYVANTKSGAISIINGKSNKVVVGVNLSVQPSGSGEIECNHGMKFSTDGYARLDIGTPCTAEPSGGSAFDSWTVQILTIGLSQHFTHRGMEL
jgi:YVTN family beta-propeller protein